MSVPLQSVPEDQKNNEESVEGSTVSQAKHEAAEIVARARRQAEAIVAEARTSKPDAASPLAALGDNAEEIIGQVRKLIKKQRQLQAERQDLNEERDAMAEQVAALTAERDELVQRLTDAVVRMEELAALANDAQNGAPAAPTASVSAPQPKPAASPPPYSGDVADRVEEPRQGPTDAVEPPRPADDTSLAARLERAEAAGSEDTSLAARLKQAERDERGAAESGPAAATQAESPNRDTPDASAGLGADGRSFYSRNSAKLPRLEGDGGRSVLSAVGDMRPAAEPKSRKNRRRKKEK